MHGELNLDINGGMRFHGRYVCIFYDVATEMCTVRVSLIIL